MSATLTSGLAELLDSRADTRDLLSSSPNLAHACLLLGRGELDLARRELALGLKDGDDAAQVIGACIAAELQRLEGDDAGAWKAAVECARHNRFHSVSSLYLRMLFPLSASRTASQSFAQPEAPAEVDAAEQEAQAQQPPEHSPSTPAPLSEEAHELTVVPDPPPDAEPFPAGWERVLGEECLTALRLVHAEATAMHGADLSGLSPLLAWLEKDLFPRTRMGALHHAAFEASSRILHHWEHSGDSLTVLLESGSQANVLAARLGKAFHELTEEEEP